MTKTVLGVGKNPAAKRHHLHAVTDGNVAICDKRTGDLVIDDDKTCEQITCSKCLAHSAVKVLTSGVKPKTETPPVDKDIGLTSATPTPKKKKAKKKTSAKKVAEMKKAADKDLAKDFKQTAAKKKAKEKPEPKKKKAKAKKPSGDFVAHLKAGRYKVHHLPSERDFFDNIEPEVISFVLEALNSLPVRWLKGETLPENYITDCRDAVTGVYKAKKMEVPEHLIRPKKKIKKKKKPEPKPDDPKVGDKKNIKGTTCRYDGDRWVAVRDPIKRRKKAEEKPKRVIKRRAPKEPEKPKRVIKRRQLDEIQKLFGRLPGSPAHAILAMVNEGSTVGEIAKSISKKFKISQSKAKAKLLAVVRKTARKQGFDILHILSGENESRDYYQIFHDETLMASRKR